MEQNWVISPRVPKNRLSRDESNLRIELPEPISRRPSSVVIAKDNSARYVSSDALEQGWLLFGNGAAAPKNLRALSIAA